MEHDEKVIEGLKHCSPSYPRLIECVKCPYEKNCYHGGRNEILLRDAYELTKSQKEQLDKYHKADVFLEAHGWKWE